MIRAAASALWSHWRRHPVQLVTLLAGIALAAGLWSAVQAINAEARASYAKAAAQIGADRLDRLSRTDGGPISVEDYVTLRRSGWQVAAVLQDRLRLNDTVVTVTGIDLVAWSDLPAITEGIATTAITPAEALTAPGLVFARPETAQTLRDHPGFPPVVNTDALPLGRVLTDIGVAEKLLNRPGQITHLLVLPDQPFGAPDLAEVAPDLTWHAARGTQDIARLTNSFHLNLTAFGLLSFVVGLFIVHGTIGLAFEQRRPMIRTLRALGLPLSVLTRLVLLELLALALAGGLVGLLLGYLVAASLLPDVAVTLRGLYGAPVEDSLALRPAWLASGLAMAVAGTLLASAQALWRFSNLPILAAPGQHGWSARPRAMKTQSLAGLSAILIGLAAFALFDGLVAGFALMAGCLLGATLLLPPVLAVGLMAADRLAHGPVAEWFVADMRAQLPSLSLALMALLLALAANIGVGTMVASFRLTFDGWLDQRLTSTLYVTARDDAQGAALAKWMAPRADAVLPIRSVEISSDAHPLFVYGIVDHDSYREHWPLIAAGADVWDRVTTGQAALVNEQMARRDGLWPGSVVTLAPGWELPVAGVYSDYGNPTGQAIVALDLLLMHFPNVPNTRFGVHLPMDRAAQLAEDLGRDFGLPPDAVILQGALKAQSRAIFEKTFVVTGALNVLTLGVAGFAILTSLLTLWTQRLPQLAPVWALGLTRAQLARLELWRALALATMTAVLALPLGLLLAWLLLAVVNVAAFGWRLPMHLFPYDWLRLFTLALITAGLAATLPALRLRRLPPAHLLKVFANER
ncbi:ABC transporter permease [Ruegeria marina]|uniref:Putative ABC transport system permease protein n=1 Tax=Ruegeria marina TaxID=639004 RepID=A0A1G6JYI7_9RHOB|nr:FtsX-like permease family protein [Ruegeria marina]SDC23661.1 putative ABC transport system permease protein [Ruegeria marina]